MGSLSDSSPSRLFQPLRVGNMTLEHRVVMAPLTRFRADDLHAQLPFTATYYGQRASVPGTLLITEATFISKQAGGYSNAPGIYTSEQITAWRRVTDTVHANGCYIFLQLWALGRTASPDVAKLEGIEVVSSSPTPMDSNSIEPRELTKEEVKSFVQDYAQAARNAIEAGFDGVEMHGGNGYLIDQFTQDNCNRRTDEYGGSIEKRSRFALEVTHAVVEAVGAEKVGIRLSPFSTFQGMRMNDPYPQFKHLLRGLKEMKIAYVHLVESRVLNNVDIEATDKINPILEAYDNASPVLLAGGFKPASARTTVDDEFKDRDIAIVFGRYFLSTPDLPFRIANNIELNEYDRNTFYKAKSEVGYTDYPFSQEYDRVQREIGSRTPS